MKMKFRLSLISSLLSIFTLTFSTIIFAQSISVYDQPSPNAKVTGTMDLSAGLIPIYNPGGEWTKVADPRNGNVGWVKSSDIKNSKDSVVFTQKIITNDQQQPYQQTPGFNNAQIQESLQKMREQQKVIQENFRGILREFNNMFNQQMDNINLKQQPTQPTPTMVPRTLPNPASNTAPNTTPNTTPTATPGVQTNPQPVVNTPTGGVKAQ